MYKLTSREALIAPVDTPHTHRALRRHGITESVTDICTTVDRGCRKERNALTRRLLTLVDDPAIEALIIAAFSGYVGGLVANTHTVDLPKRELWAIGLEALARSVKAAARCDAGDFHIIKSTSRDFCRAMARHRRHAQAEAEAYKVLFPNPSALQPIAEAELTAASIDELVEWLATVFDADKHVARMVVATRLGGYPLGAKDAPTVRARNCRERQRLEARIRGYVSPAEGLADHVLERIA